MSTIAQNTIAEINRLHKLANQAAHEAIDYAKQTGLLLLEVKRQLAHGEFGQWIQDNLEVSSRQAQRYMQVASGKTIAVRELAGKNDTVSHLNRVFSETELDQIAAGTWTPKWVPEAGHWYCCVTASEAFWVVPDISDASSFHVSRLYSDPDLPDDSDEGLFDGTRWPEPAQRVELRLRYLGLSQPSEAIWKCKRKEGLPQPFGAPEHHGFITVKAADGTEKLVRDCC